MFADPFEIGYDPSVRRVPNSSAYVYRIGEHASDSPDKDRYFRTVNSIVVPSRICITGRATRVMEVQEVLSFEDPTPIPDSKIYVLRDAWMEQDARTERQIQAAIFDDLEAFGEQLLTSHLEPDQFADFDEDMKAEVRDIFSRNAYKEYFLTIVCDSVGSVSKTVAPGCAQIEDIFDPEPQKQSPIRQIITSPTEHKPSDSSAYHTGSERQYRPVKPYRLVFAERCSTLDDGTIKSLQDVFSLARECLTGNVQPSSPLS
ncbi:hypothetical protein MD484_g8009, partial [Candolleomyces efflorescens]